MKKFLLFLFISTFSLSAAISQKIVFSENFESLSIPAGWTQERVVGSDFVPWTIQSGGHQGNPPSAYQGTYNAFFQYQSYNGEITKFITPPIDLSDVLKPELRFAHAQDIWYASENNWWDRLKIYYKRGTDSTWVLLKEYLEPEPDWTMRSILLPDSSLSSTYYIAFEGITSYGHGVCIDTVRIVETGVIPKYVESIDVVQASTSFIATGTKHNPILRIDLNVLGNDGTLILDSIAVKSLNSSDNDISPNGVKIFATTSAIFSDVDSISSGIFSSGAIIFDNLNYDIPRGYSYLWITYDIKTDSNHELHGHIADAKIDAECININDNLYPYVNKSPDGSRIIYEAILYDNFESNKGWRFTGEFELNKPEGKIGERGKPDPSEALSGINVIGTDLTNDGMYLNNLTDTAYVAASPILNCMYYKDIYLTFYRWLNIDLFDKSKILASSDNINWSTIWQNESFYADDAWSLQQFNLSNYFTRKSQTRLKFTLGPTNDINRYTGWNIDDVVIIGNYISKDVGVINWITPVDGCGHTDEEKVTITIKNFAGDPLNDPLPVSFSFDGGTTIYYDTIQTPNLAVEGTLTYEITKPIDLTTPGWYNNVYATTNLPGDEDVTNNKINKQIFIVPTYTLPYSQNFETNYGYYRAGGTNFTWEYGTPATTNPVINSAASGTKAWVTNLNGVYSNNDSSYLESPCFNFAGKDFIVFEFKCKGISEDKTDGLSVLYSFDEGVNWYLLPNDHDYYWNWYNETNISELELPGIDITNGMWMTFRQLLTSTFSNQSSVKFRFVFESNDDNIYEGFGIDDIKIYEAPYDVGVINMSYPYNRCEWNDTTHVKVEIKNIGPTAVKSGTKIPLVLKFNSTTINDTLTLTSNLVPLATKLFTFNATIDMSYAGDYDFTVYTKLESDTYFYNETVSNDTTYATVSVLGMPRYNPFHNQIGDNPIDTFLVAGQGYIQYDWKRPILADTIALTTDTLFIKDNEGWYYVTVTNSEYCTASDSVEVVNSEIDLAMDHIDNELVDSCERNLLTEISIRFKNKSITELSIDDTVPLAYQINDLPYVRDTLVLLSTVAVDATEDFTFTQKADFRTPDDYTLKVFIDILRDLDHSDDTLTANFKTKGYVDITFEDDTIYSSQADTLALTPLPIYSDYIWNTTETTNTITPSTNISQWYIVTVTDPTVCGSGSDSIYVETYDFGINNIVSPTSACEHISTENIQVSVHNYSGNSYPIGTKIPFRYNYDNQGWVNDSSILTNEFTSGTNKTLSFHSTIDASSIGNHSLDILINSSQDANLSNDSLEIDFETWGYPNVELAYDTIFTTQADTVVLVATPGLFSYSWNNGLSTNDTLVITNNYSENYIVEVTDEHNCAIDSDSTLIVTYNLGISSLLSPKNGCQHSENEVVRIAVKNYSNDVLSAGVSIPVGFILNGILVHETFLLDYDLGPSQIGYYTFTSKVNLAGIDAYNFKLFTDFDLDVYNSNDTLVNIIKTFGYPSIEIGSDIFTAEPETLTLIAPSGFNYYKWNDGTIGNTLNVSYPATKLYSITVTDINGCSATDQLNVYTYDVAASGLISPISQCELTGDETVNVDVINNSQDTLLTGEPINISYTLNAGTQVNESFTLSETLLPDHHVYYTFTQTADLSANQVHEFELFAQLANIDVNADDAITLQVDFQRPILDLGPDINTGAAEHTIDAGAGYASYLWFDGTTITQTYTVDINDQNPNHYYAVEVSNDFGCVDKDSIQVTFTTTPDLAVTSMVSPVSDCWNESEKYPVHIVITNTGVVNITPGTSFEVGYTLDGGTAVTETFNLSGAMNTGNTREHTFTDKISFPSAKIYHFKPFVKLGDDNNVNNDTLKTGTNIDISAPEVILGANDTISFTSDTYEIEPSESYITYLWNDGSEESTLIINQTGTYSVTVTDEYGCQGEGKIYCIKLSTGIDNLIEGNGYKISYYPNPVSEKLMVQFDNRKSTDVIIEIISSSGQILYNTNLKDVENSLEQIDVSQYARGVYYFKFKINEEIYIRKIIFQ